MEEQLGEGDIDVSSRPRSALGRRGYVRIVQLWRGRRSPVLLQPLAGLDDVVGQHVDYRAVQMRPDDNPKAVDGLRVRWHRVGREHPAALPYPR